jgi:general stress protein 26
LGLGIRSIAMTERHDPAELEEKLYAELRKVRAAMVGVVGGQPHHFQPMKPYVVAEEKPVWFLCRRDNALIGQLAGSSTAMVVVVSEDHHLHACIGGELHEERDQGRIDLFWNSVAEAWLPEGKTSPDVTLLRLDPADAEIWLSDNAFKLAWAVAKANYTRTQADSGEKAHIALD